MKTSKFIACILAAATVAGAVTALGENSHSTFSLGFGVQYWNPKEIDKLDGNGFNLDEDGFWGGNLIARITPSEYFGIEFRAGGTGVWDGKTYYVDGKKYETDVTFLCCPVEAGLVLMLPVSKVFSLYAGGGVGYYYYDIDIETSSKHGHHYHTKWTKHIDLEDDVGWYCVGGLKIRLGTFVSLFGEARYTSTETSLKHVNDSTIDCSGLGIQAGLMFDF